MNLSRCCDYTGEKEEGRGVISVPLCFNNHIGTVDTVLATYKVGTRN